MTNINIKIKPEVVLPVYRDDLFDYTYRYGVFWGGRGSGKTVHIIMKLFAKGLREKRNILLMTKNTNRVEDSVWKELLDVIKLFNMEQYFDLNKTKFKAICKLNGTQFRCVGLDESEKIKGYSNISDVYLDEATSFTEDDFLLIDGTVRSKKYNLPLQVYVSFNPVSKANWVYKFFGFSENIIPDNTKIFHTTYLDNPFIDESYLLRMNNLKRTNPQRYKIEAIGEFVSLDKLVFTDYKVEEFDNAEIEGTLCCGLDFGFVNDITAFVASIATADKKLYIFQEWGATNKTNPEIANVITSLGFAKSNIVCDSAEQKSIAELQRNGIRRATACAKGPDSIIHGIDKLKEYEIIIHPNCQGIITELENYTWQKDKQTGEYTNKPIDKFNHYIDALRYSIQLLDDSKRIKIMSRLDLGI